MLWFSGTSWPHLKRPTLKGFGIASSMLESRHYDPSDWRGRCVWGFHRISQAEQRSGGITKTKDLVEEKRVKVSSIDPRVVKAGSASDRAEQAWLLRTSTEAPTNNTRSIGSIGHLLPRKIQSRACLNMSSRWNEYMRSTLVVIFKLATHLPLRACLLEVRSQLCLQRSSQLTSM